MCVSLCISQGKNLWTTVDGHWCGMPVHRDIVCVDFEGPADRSEFIVTCCWSGWCDDLLADSAVPLACAYSWKHYNDCTSMPYSFILFFILYTLHLLLFCLCTFCFCNPIFLCFICCFTVLFWWTSLERNMKHADAVDCESVRWAFALYSNARQ